MSSYTMGRRALLGGAAATMAWLASGRGRADRIMTAEPAPTRFVVFFTPNGTVRDRWLPSGGETDFSLSPILSPLARHRRRLAVIDGLDMRSTENGPGDGHQKGMGHMLTGTSLLTGSGFDGLQLVVVDQILRLEHIHGLVVIRVKPLILAPLYGVEMVQ